jgi:hypothetical protein
MIKFLGMVSTTVSKNTKCGFDLPQSKEFDRRAKVRLQSKIHVPLKNHDYTETSIPPTGHILTSVAENFDKCFIKCFTPSKSVMGMISILLVKYIDVRGEFSLQ